MPQQKTTRPPVGINPAIPIPIQRELRKVAQFAFDAQDHANSALAALPGKVSKSTEDLNAVAKYTASQLQAGGSSPLNLTALPGNPGQPQGPGAGTYTTGAKLTSGGSPGTITIDQYGRITAIHQAT